MDLDFCDSYYAQRLIATKFGDWITWLNEDKKHCAENDNTAISFSIRRMQDSVVSRLISLVYLRNRLRYRTVLTFCMHRLLLLRRGLTKFRWFKEYSQNNICNSESGYETRLKQRIDQLRFQNSNLLRLFGILRDKMLRRRSITQAINRLLKGTNMKSSASESLPITAQVLKTNKVSTLALGCLQKWCAFTVSRLSAGAQLSRHRHHWKRPAMRRFMSK